MYTLEELNPHSLEQLLENRSNPSNDKLYRASPDYMYTIL